MRSRSHNPSIKSLFLALLRKVPYLTSNTTISPPRPHSSHSFFPSPFSYSLPLSVCITITLCSLPTHSLKSPSTMASSLLYRRPGHVDSARASIIGDEKVGSVKSDSAGSSRSSYLPIGVPENLSFDRIINNDTCPVSSQNTPNSLCPWGFVFPHQLTSSSLARLGTS